MKKKILEFLQNNQLVASEHFQNDDPTKIVRMLSLMSEEELNVHPTLTETNFKLRLRISDLVHFLYHHPQLSLHSAIKLWLMIIERDLTDDRLSFAEKNLDNRFWAAEEKFRHLPLKKQLEIFEDLPARDRDERDCVLRLSEGLNLEEPAKSIRDSVAFFNGQKNADPKNLLDGLKQVLRWMT